MPRIQPGAVAVLAPLAPFWDTPPEYTTFGRQQSIDRTIAPEDLLRVWVVYIDQGDGLLIQLSPQKQPQQVTTVAAAVSVEKGPVT